MLTLGLVAAGLASPVDPRVAAVIDDARADGLPTAILVSKAREGAVKGIAPERVADAVSGLADDLRRARMSLGTGNPALLSPAARALGAGVPAGDVWRLAAGVRGADALTAATDLTERGFSPSEAASAAGVLEEAPELVLGPFELSAVGLLRTGVPPEEVPARLRSAAAAGGAP